jgi:hypothetical protein
MKIKEKGRWRILTICLIVFLFLWFQAWPSFIRIKCSLDLNKKAESGSLTYTRANNSFRRCLVKYGLKAESLFVNTK